MDGQVVALATNFNMFAFLFPRFYLALKAFKTTWKSYDEVTSPAKISSSRKPLGRSAPNVDLALTRKTKRLGEIGSGGQTQASLGRVGGRNHLLPEDKVDYSQLNDD